MTTYVALLRAVNVGGRKPVAMADLRALLEGLGLEEARTLLQSGNCVFRGPARPGATLERRLAKEAEQRLGLETEFFVRTAKEWSAIVEGNPFPEEAEKDPGHLLVLCLSGAPSRAGVEALRSAISGRERVAVSRRELYAHYPDGVGRSRLTVALIERKLGARATGRNWNTVLKLAALAGA